MTLIVKKLRRAIIRLARHVQLSGHGEGYFPLNHHLEAHVGENGYIVLYDDENEKTHVIVIPLEYADVIQELGATT